MALENTRRVLGDIVSYCKDVECALRDADAVIIATEWSIYREVLEPELLKRSMRKPVVVDGRRIIKDLENFLKNGIKVYAIGLNRYKEVL